MSNHLSEAESIVESWIGRGPALPPYRVLHEAISAALSARDEELARRDKQLEASAKVALKLSSDNQRLLEALEEVEEYLDDRSDADYDDTGFVPNTEMRLLAVVRVALNTGRSPEP